MGDEKTEWNAFRPGYQSRFIHTPKNGQQQRRRVTYQKSFTGMTEPNILTKASSTTQFLAVQPPATEAGEKKTVGYPRTGIITLVSEMSKPVGEITCKLY